MATGYVHFIVSLNTISYKRSGTLELKGALLQDEQAAVAGTSAKPYTSAPAHVVINIEGQPKYEYNYEVLNHPMMTPAIAAAVVGEAVGVHVDDQFVVDVDEVGVGVVLGGGGEGEVLKVY